MKVFLTISEDPKILVSVYDIDAIQEWSDTDEQARSLIAIRGIRYNSPLTVDELSKKIQDLLNRTN